MLTSEAEHAKWLVDLLDRKGSDVIAAWVLAQQRGSTTFGPAPDPRAMHAAAASVVDALRAGLTSGRVSEPVGPEYEGLRRLLADASGRGARSGATPTETATAVLTLREALYTTVQREGLTPEELAESTLVIGRLVDAMALLTFETFVDGRQEVINRQGLELLELSTPVVRLWTGIVGVPLVGTLDSSRAQVVMESLLQAIVDERATVAILDITGVPTVDTLVAQHLLKTVAATRLMGADCIISGIRPSTAQTIVQLGIDLTDVTTRSTLADALETAIARVGARTNAAAEGP
ncbi:MAG: STAS domain-containing protein [Actinomycetes bacterium]